jgi:hypothetical protein
MLRLGHAERRSEPPPSRSPPHSDLRVRGPCRDSGAAAARRTCGGDADEAARQRLLLLTLPPVAARYLVLPRLSHATFAARAEAAPAPPFDLYNAAAGADGGAAAAAAAEHPVALSELPPHDLAVRSPRICPAHTCAESNPARARARARGAGAARGEPSARRRHPPLPQARRAHRRRRGRHRRRPGRRRHRRRARRGRGAPRARARAGGGGAARGGQWRRRRAAPGAAAAHTARAARAAGATSRRPMPAPAPVARRPSSTAPRPLVGPRPLLNCPARFFLLTPRCSRPWLPWRRPRRAPPSRGSPRCRRCSSRSGWAGCRTPRTRASASGRRRGGCCSPSHRDQRAGEVQNSPHGERRASCVSRACLTHTTGITHTCGRPEAGKWTGALFMRRTRSNSQDTYLGRVRTALLDTQARAGLMTPCPMVPMSIGMRIASLRKCTTQEPRRHQIASTPLEKNMAESNSGSGSVDAGSGGATGRFHRV